MVVRMRMDVKAVVTDRIQELRVGFQQISYDKNRQGHFERATMRDQGIKITPVLEQTACFRPAAIVGLEVTSDGRSAGQCTDINYSANLVFQLAAGDQRE